MPATPMLYFMVRTTNYIHEKSGRHFPWPNHGWCCAPLPKDFCLPCLHLLPSGPRPCGTWGTLHVCFLSYTRLLVLSSINSLTGSVLKNRSTTTSNGTSLSCWSDCFMDVNAGHSLHKCQAVSISSSRQQWHV